MKIFFIFIYFFKNFVCFIFSFRDRNKQQDHRNVVVSSRMERDNGQRGDINNGSSSSLNNNNNNREQWVTPPRHTQHSMWPANDAKSRTVGFILKLFLEFYLIEFFCVVR